ncbi:RES domain protein [compost metagenome]
MGTMMDVASLPVVEPDWLSAYRIISSAFPPIPLFEDVLDPADLDMAFAIEGVTNDRLLDEAGLLSRVPAEDRISGPGSSPVMAAFTHIGANNRFCDGNFGVYYCASSLDSAVAETAHHRAKFLAATSEGPLELTMRTYVCMIVRPLHDVRAIDELHDPDASIYPHTQDVAARVRETGSWGLLYRSVRAEGHECAAIFRPPAVSIPIQGQHLRYVWDGHVISHVLKVTSL